MSDPKQMDVSANAVEMFLKNPQPPEPGKSAVWFYGQDYFAGAEHWIETWMVTGDHVMMSGTPAGAEKIIHLGPDGHKGGPYPKYHQNADNLMIFTGTYPANPRDLGAHVEFHLGEGAQEQVFHFDEPRTIVIPRGVRHFPMIVSGWRRPFVVTDILTAPTRTLAGTETDFSYETPA